MLPSKFIALTLCTLFVCVHLASASSVTEIDELDLQGQQPRQQLSLAPAQSPVANDVVAIKEGADLDLSCPILVKNEDMIISWTCDNEPANIRSSRIHVTDSGKLRIRSSKVGDSCNYRCEVADGHGALSVIIKVIIVDKRLMDELTRRATLAGGNFPPSSLQTVNDTNNDAPTTGGGETGAPTKKRIIGKQQREHRSHTPVASLDESTPSLRYNKHQELGSEIEMQIEPAEIAVERNKTFSLECRIKHSPSHEQTTFGSPQIIWLKELMGAPPQSINEALEKNLIYLDGVYYHSLNWPRAITYANGSSSASSALLIRQSNFMHSGRYVCFAGYPASVMNLDSSNSMLGAQATRATNDSHPATSKVLQNRSPHLRYKIAAARVRVDDDEGEAGYLASLTWSSSQARAAHRSGQLARDKTTDASHVFMSVVSTNTWQRNLTFLLLILCGSLMLVKLVMVMRNRARKEQPLQHMDMINDDVEGDSHSTSSPPPPLLPKHSSVNIPRPAGPFELAGERTGSDPILLCSANALPTSLDTFRDRFSDVPANSLIAGNNPLRDEYRIDQELLNERLEGIDMGNNNSEHVYSEIGANSNNNNHNNNLTIPKSVRSEPYYKLPNKDS